MVISSHYSVQGMIPHYSIQTMIPEGDTIAWMHEAGAAVTAAVASAAVASAADAAVMDFSARVTAWLRCCE